MTVAELIERLKAFNGNMPVFIDDWTEGYWPPAPLVTLIESVVIDDDGSTLILIVNPY